MTTSASLSNSRYSTSTLRLRASVSHCHRGVYPSSLPSYVGLLACIQAPAYDERIAALMETARAIRSNMATDNGRRSRGNSSSTVASSRLRGTSNSGRDRTSSSTPGGQHHDRTPLSTSASEALTQSSHGHIPLVRIDSVDPSTMREGRATGARSSSHRERAASSSEGGLKVVNPRAGDCLTQGMAYTIEVRPELS